LNIFLSLFKLKELNKEIYFNKIIKFNYMPLPLKIIVGPEIEKKKSSSKYNQINVKKKQQKQFFFMINRHLEANKA
jgi:hypothetical protein